MIRKLGDLIGNAVGAVLEVFLYGASLIIGI